ncbi:LytR C-terminal domain-containing protein [Motilibacter aurantiacus]|uniref:LytR C-terminal domain-containing protein n=1 Tax=Motilibacter aurantiacus TaxID=2714955 RepID=UPI001E5042D1|nr:LytR C-terminal domain-containing protein [Motilibacter aurantiacus]
MLTPRGFDPSRLGRSHGRRRSRARGLLAAVLALALLAGAGYGGWWAYDRWQGREDGSPAAGSAPVASSTCAPGRPSPAASPQPTPPAPRQVTVNVYNATTKAGLAATVSSRLQARGFRVAEVGNDPVGRPLRATAQVRSGPQGAAGARTVAAQVPGAELVTDRRRGTTVDLVLGSSYSRLRAPGAAAAALAPSPAPTPGC